MMATSKITRTKKIRVGFLDEEAIQINRITNYFSEKDLSCLYTQDASEAVNWVINGKIDILVSDFNLEQDDDGITILESVRSIDDEIKLILFSGFTFDSEKRSRCSKINALTIRKHEGYTTLYQNIMQLFGKGKKEEDLGTNEENERLKRMVLTFASKLIVDLKKLNNESPNFKIHYGEDTFSPSEMLDEINNLTEIGKNFVEDYFYGINISKGL